MVLIEAAVVVEAVTEDKAVKDEDRGIGRGSCGLSDICNPVALNDCQ